MLRKKVILGMPHDRDIFKVIKSNLENVGYEVDLLASEDNFKYKNSKQHFVSFLRKNLLGDKNYKNELKKRFYDEKSFFKINELENNSVFSIIIRPEIFSIDLLNLLKTKSKKIIAYQWDGLDRFKNVFEYIPIFDRFYVFDKNNILKYPEYELYPSNNFYFDKINLEKEKNSNIQKVAYYIGYFDDRVRKVIKIGEILKQLNYNVKIILSGNYHSKSKYLENPLIRYSDKSVPYLENLQNSYNSDIILDFHNPIHNGLSFRPFEALGFDKKLITNNELIKEYDFYNPNNIFVWNDSNLDQLEEFLNKPYCPIKSEIKEKYSFSNWFFNKFEL